MYREMRQSKVEEIVVLLDLFEGKISLTEILNTDISLLNQLRDAKLLIKKKQEAVANAEARGIKTGGTNSVKLSNPETFMKGKK